MIQYTIIKHSPRLLRWYHCRVLLDWVHLKSLLPTKGNLLDVGCGVGSLDYKLACAHPELNILGIDVSPTSIEMARAYNALPNIRYACQRLESVQGKFDCVLFVDVFHHVPPPEYESLLTACRRLLNPGGYVLIKDVERRRGEVSLWMDRYLSGCKEVYLHNCDELMKIVSGHLRVERFEVKYRFPFPHQYIKATG